MELRDWISQNYLDVSFEKQKGITVLVIDKERSLLIEPREQQFVEDFRLNVTAEEISSYFTRSCTSFVFRFGGKWYYSPISAEISNGVNAYWEEHGTADQKDNRIFSDPEWLEEIGLPHVNLTPYKYIGRAVCSPDLSDSKYTHLGVHGGYELLNGSRLYPDWCKKAKFINVAQLGICERNTLAGTLSFQLACEYAGIKSILGETITVKLPSETELFIEAKVFALTKKGWNNLLHINKHINVVNDTQYIDENILIQHGEGVVFVWSSHNVERLKKAQARMYDKCFDMAFYQFDTVDFLSNDTDQRFLEQQARLIKDKFLPPILLNDTYYLDKEDAEIKKILNKIDKGRALNQSNGQYFKDLDGVLDCIDPLFELEDSLYDFIGEALKNANKVGDTADFKIEVGVFKLPKYERINDQLKFKTNEDLFHHLIETSLIKVIPEEDREVCRERLAEEIEVIKEGGFVDYFLILWDIIEFCNRENILTGVGRGSAGGSLVAYLLGIIKMNPLDYDLLFSRFLNKGRITVSMPDIDTDFESARRDEVKRYMEQRYGENHVCSIGTYGTMKLRAAIQDFGRLEGIDSKLKNYMTKVLDVENGGEHWISLFKTAMEVPELKNFIQKYATMVNNIPLCMNQPKNSSVHAAGVIITPKQDAEGNPMTIFDWLPIKKMDGILISEWEGPQCETAGFLKEDILGIKQLDKFRQIFDLIEQNTQQRLTLMDADIPLDDPNVYELFHEGFNGDLFHFGSPGLKGYSQDVKPTNIEDLIAMIALYRPGVMQIGAHIDFVRIRDGKMQPSYDFMLEDITKETASILVYQEQVMKACQVIGDFTEVESDDIRRAMGKKKLKDLLPYKERFLQKAIDKGCGRDEAETIWDKLEQFASYGFNKSHAAAYSITGYKGQWLKYHYPIEYWTVALSNADNDTLSSFISEIKKLDQGIEIAPPNINKSAASFIPDFNTGKIYWSLRVKQVGPATLDAIMTERNTNGQFFSFEEFMERIPRNKCKKGQLFNLILAGAFDEMHKIKNVQDRIKLINIYKQLVDNDIDEVFSTKLILHEHFWLIRQKELTGFGHLDYYTLVCQSKEYEGKSSQYVDPLKFFTEETTEKKNVITGGILKSFVERKTRKGDKFANLVIESNDEEIIATVWSEVWEPNKEEISAHKGGIILIEGLVSFNDYHKKNTLQTQRSSSVVLI